MMKKLFLQVFIFFCGLVATCFFQILTDSVLKELLKAFLPRGDALAMMPEAALISGIVGVPLGASGSLIFFYKYLACNEANFFKFLTGFFGALLGMAGLYPAAIRVLETYFKFRIAYCTPFSYEPFPLVLFGVIGAWIFINLHQMKED